MAISAPGSARAASAQSAGAVTIYAAASLKEALDHVLAGRAGVKAIYGSSATLARQVERGAPADIFVSADREWMDYLDTRKRLQPGSRVTLLGNRLVLIAPASSSVTLTIAPGFPLSNAIGNGRLAIADPTSVPAGKYAKAALQSLGVWDAVAGRLAPSDNVRMALLLVARGEVPLGVVYATDAQAERKVRVVGTFPESSHPAIVYPAAVLATGQTARAAVVMDHLRSPQALALWRQHGFRTTP